MKKILIVILSALLLVVTRVSTVEAVGPKNTTTYDFITTDNGMQGFWATDYFHSKVTITPSQTEGCYR